MTDGKRFELIEKTKKDIKNIGFQWESKHNDYIKIESDNFLVAWKKEYSGYTVIQKKLKQQMKMEEWENYSSEIDNLCRAILWVNGIKEIILEN